MLKKKKGATARRPQPLRCFVVRSSAGRFWTGRAWTRDTRQSLRWTDGADPWQEARQAADALGADGVACGVAYFPGAGIVT